MADWIRMRASLLANPRVTRMARLLLQDGEFTAWLCPCKEPATSDDGVTKRDIPVVTRIVIGGLLATWAMVNDTAARDGIVRHASSRDIDETAGIPGFGEAMKAVAWLEDLPNGEGVRFVNFEEHNSPQKERSLTGKTGAQRQAEYRERKRREQEASHESDGAGDGTSDGQVTSRNAPREEKNRRDISSSLRSEEIGASKPRPSRKREEVTLTTYLETCRAEGRKPLPNDHPIRAYCHDAGISEEMLQVAWCVFRDEYTTGTNKAKRYKDWPGHFANSVRGCWARLWFTDGAEVKWTSRGQQEKAVLDARQRAKEGAVHEHA